MLSGHHHFRLIFLWNGSSYPFHYLIPDTVYRAFPPISQLSYAHWALYLLILLFMTGMAHVTHLTHLRIQLLVLQYIVLFKAYIEIIWLH